MEDCHGTSGKCSALHKSGLVEEKSASSDLIASGSLDAVQFALSFATLQVLINPLQIVTVLGRIGISLGIHIAKDLVLWNWHVFSVFLKREDREKSGTSSHCCEGTVSDARRSGRHPWIVPSRD